jgi:hypothetical protein
MMRIFLPIALAAALGSSALPAGAQIASEHSGTDAEQRACTPDVFRLCAAAIPNETRIIACLKNNKAKLSPACRKVFS